MNEPKEERPEWVERLRSDAEFPGRTFTAEIMDRIERRALSGAKERRGLRVRLLTAGSVGCVVAFAIWLVVAGPLAGSGKSEEVLREGKWWPIPSESTAPVPTASAMPSEFNVPGPTPSGTEEIVRVKYRLKAPVSALPESQPYASRVSFEGNTTDTYYIEESAGDHVKIVDPFGNAGWVPSWYIDAESLTNTRVQEVAPYQMIVDKPVTYRLYPDEPTPSGFELWPGKVVNVIRSYGDDWLEIRIVTYDSPYLENKWVRKDELIPYEESKAKEGFAYPPDQHAVTLYDESGEARQELPPLTPIYIQGEQGDRYWITAGGGISGYLDKKDFMPNPFSIKVVDQWQTDELEP